MVSRATQSKSRHKHAAPAHPTRRISDIGPYVAFFLIWAFATLIAFLVAADIWMHLSLGLVAAFALYVTLCTSKAYAGQPLMQWQKGLVRLPLMIVGAGSERVDSIKGDSRVRTASIIALIVSIALIGLTIWLVMRSM